MLSISAKTISQPYNREKRLLSTLPSIFLVGDIRNNILSFLSIQDIISFSRISIQLFNMRFHALNYSFLRAQWWSRIPVYTEVISSLIPVDESTGVIIGGRLPNPKPAIVKLTINLNQYVSMLNMYAMMDKLKKLSYLTTLSLNCFRLQGLRNLPLLAFLESVLKASAPLTHLVLSNVNGAYPIHAIFSILQRFSTLKTLTLAHYQGSELSDKLGQLEQLQELVIDGNDLTALPDVFEKLTHLTQFSIMSNTLSILPASLSQLTKLEILEIFVESLITIPTHITLLSDLRELTIVGDCLTHLPDSITALKSLQTLVLNGEGLVSLPVELGSLSRLRVLSLRGPYTELPRSIGLLLNLERLDIQSVNLHILPSTIGDLINLRYARVVADRLTTLPDTVGQLVNLIEFDIVSDSLSILPSSVAQLTKIQRLTLEIQATSSAIFAFPHLHILKIIADSIHLPAEILQLPHLYALEIKGRFKDFPATIWQMSRLESLKLNSAFLEILPLEMGNLVGLKRLSVKAGKLRTVPITINQLQSLQMLTIRCISPTLQVPDCLRTLPYLRELTLDAHSISFLMPSSFSLQDFPQLRQLTLPDFTGLPNALAEHKQVQVKILSR